MKQIKKYLQAVGMFRDFSDPSQDPDFAQVRERLPPNVCLLFFEAVVVVVFGFSPGVSLRELVPAKSLQKNRVLKD